MYGQTVYAGYSQCAPIIAPTDNTCYGYSDETNCNADTNCQWYPEPIEYCKPCSPPPDQSGYTLDWKCSDNGFIDIIKCNLILIDPNYDKNTWLEIGFLMTMEIKHRHVGQEMLIHILMYLFNRYSFWFFQPVTVSPHTIRY